jgi:hypothetical protein
VFGSLLLDIPESSGRELDEHNLIPNITGIHIIDTLSVANQEPF